MNKKFKVVVSVLIALVLITAGTFAWVNLTQSMLNEWNGDTTPGGTTHDDFCKPQKDVYIENWGKTPLFVRIRLDEYMEIGEGAGLKGEYENGFFTGVPNPNDLSKSLMAGAKIDEKDTWQPHMPAFDNVTACDPNEGGTSFHNYWTWTMGGWKYYEKAPSPEKEIQNYVHQNINDYNGTGPNIGRTLNAVVVTIQQWIDMGKPIGEYWVIDTDGWAYWAAPLMPGEATGLLLHKVELTTDPDDSYYYAINVIAQMATKGLSGNEGDGSYGNYESFYNGFDDDHTATNEGKDLLDIIVNNSDQSGPSTGGIFSDNGTMIGNKLYLKQGATANLTLNPNVFGSDNVTWTRDPVSTPNFTFNSLNNQATVAASNNAAIGSKLTVTAKSTSNLNKQATITVIVIDKNAVGVVIGGDGNPYLDWGDNTFTRLDGNTGLPAGDMICGGMDEKPGTGDDRYDIVFTHDGVKLLGPNPNGSYQSKGPDGKLGTADDELWWKKPGNENTNVGDLNFNDGDENTGDFTSTPPANVEILSVVVTPASASLKKGTSEAFNAVVNKVGGTDSAGVTWSVLGSATLSNSGTGSVTLTVNSSAASGTSIKLIATSITDPSIYREVIITVKADIEDVPAIADDGNGNGGRVLTDAQTGDGEWIEIARNGDYSLIVRKNYINTRGDHKDQPDWQYLPFNSTVYKNSNVNNAINDWFNGVNIQGTKDKLASGARLRQFTVQNNAINVPGTAPTTAGMTNGFSKPTNVKIPSGSNDVAFILSYGEAANFCSNTHDIRGANPEIQQSSDIAKANFAKMTIPASGTYNGAYFDFFMWLRSPGDNNTMGILANSGRAFQQNRSYPGTLAYPALWVDQAIFDAVN